MKKYLCIFIAIVMAISCAAILSACAKTYEIAMVTDVGQLQDKGFNQGTYEGVKAYAEANNKTYKYYQPANGNAATDNDREDAFNAAIKNGAKIIVAPGFLQATAMTKVAIANPDVKFVFIDGWSLTDTNNNPLANVVGISYKEEQVGYMAGYAAVKDGYRKLGYTGGGGGENPACNRFGFGFVQGASAAAVELNVTVDMKYSYLYGNTFSESPELTTQITGWYTTGTEVVFACGGSMFNSVKAAAESSDGGKIIGVDVDQADASPAVITSATKGLATSVGYALKKFYDNKWTEMGTSQTLGAAEDAVGLPTATASWKLQNYTVAMYNTLLASIKAGTVTISADYTTHTTQTYANVNFDYVSAA